MSGHYDCTTCQTEDNTVADITDEEIIEKKPRKVREHEEKYYINGKFSSKTYYEINKEKLLVKAHQQVQCECGALVQKGKLLKHKVTDKHRRLLLEV